MTKRQYCAICGDDIGELTKFSDKDDTCGKLECDSYMRDNLQAEREEAHERLDKDMGY